MVTTKEVAVRDNFTPGVISQKQAAFLINSIWPKAPEAEVRKAALICQQYQLNPLMKMIFLIEYGKEWVTVLSIKATRQIAKSNGYKYSFVDGPRIMTTDEQKTILGEVDSANLWAIVKLKDQKGDIYPGYGNIPKDAKAYGTDKGNSKFNLAFYRAERNAIDRMAPGTLPDVDVIDDQYTPVPNLKAAIEEGRQEFAAQVEVDKNDLYPEDPIPAAATVVEQPKAKRDPSTIKDSKELSRALWNDFGLTISQQLAELNIASWNDLTISPPEAYRTVAATR